jgi:hypothetical protein
VKTEELIVRLASEAAPVRRLPPIGRRLLSWLVITVPIVGVFVAVAGPRADLAARLTDSSFVVLLALISAMALSAAVGALALSVPGEDRSSLVRALPLAAAAGWALALGVLLRATGPVVTQLAGEPMHAACVLHISAMAILPALVLGRLVRQAAPLAPRWTGLFAAAAALASGAAGSAIICPIDRPAHQTIFHLLPVIALSISGLLVAEVWLDRLKGTR